MGGQAVRESAGTEILECIEMRDLYAVLGVPRTATAEDIKTRYRRHAKALHPDGNKNDPKAAAHFAELNAAYEILGDEDKRKAFDRGEIDARGQPARRGLPARQPAQPIAAGLMIILLMLAATIIRTPPAPDEIHVNSSVKDTVLPRAGANDGHAGAAHAQSVPRLIFQPSASFAATNAVPLGIQVSGQATGLTLEISGLPPGMTISSGRALGTGRWRILAADVGNAAIHPPPGFIDTIDLTVELRLADDTVVDRRSLRLQWLRTRTAPAVPIKS
jgi:curved DNA-binding protein CbpA